MFNTDKQSAAISYSCLSNRCKPKFVLFSNLGIVSSIKVQQFRSLRFQLRFSFSCPTGGTWVHRTYFGDIDVGDVCWKQNELVTSLRCCLPIQYIEKITNIMKTVANKHVMIVSPTSSISHNHKITNITLSLTSLSP